MSLYNMTLNEYAMFTKCTDVRAPPRIFDNSYEWISAKEGSEFMKLAFAK